MTLTARQERDLARQAFGLPSMVAEHRLPPTNHPPIDDGTGAGHGAPQYPHPIGQQTAVGGIVNVRFHHRTIDPQLLSLCDACGLRLLDHQIIQGVQRFRCNQRFTRLDGTVIRHILIVDMTEASPPQAAFHFVFHLAITPAVQPPQDRQTKCDLHRRRLTTGFQRLRRRVRQVETDPQNQSLILQQFIHLRHLRVKLIFEGRSGKEPIIAWVGYNQHGGLQEQDVG